MNYYENYTKQMIKSLEDYEKYIISQKNFTEEYINERKILFKELEEQFKLEINKLQYMNVVDIYLNMTNLNLPRMYWETYVLWLEKIKLVYDLDNDYLKEVMHKTNHVLQFNPFLKAYTIFDVYKHFNIFNK